jgi:putative transposase
MSDDEPQRKTIQHFNIAGHAHLLTFSCYQRMPILTDDRFRRALSHYINRGKQLHSWSLIAFVYMPEHIHLLVHPQKENCEIEKLLYAMKKPFSDHVKRLLIQADSPLLQKLLIKEPRKNVFHFWQQGPGHDRNLISVENCVKAAEYLHNNPVRRKLCSSPDKWRWSSWKHYHVSGFSDEALPRVDGFPA